MRCGAGSQGPGPSARTVGRFASPNGNNLTEPREAVFVLEPPPSAGRTSGEEWASEALQGACLSRRDNAAASGPAPDPVSGCTLETPGRWPSVGSSRSLTPVRCCCEGHKRTGSRRLCSFVQGKPLRRGKHVFSTDKPKEGCGGHPQSLTPETPPLRSRWRPPSLLSAHRETSPNSPGRHFRAASLERLPTVQSAHTYFPLRWRLAAFGDSVLTLVPFGQVGGRAPGPRPLTHVAVVLSRRDRVPPSLPGSPHSRVHSVTRI